MDCSMLRTVGCFTDNGCKLLWENKTVLASKSLCHTLKPAMRCSPLEKFPSFRLRYPKCHQRSRRASWEAMVATPVRLDADTSAEGDVATAESEETPEASFEEEEGAAVEDAKLDGEETGPRLMTAEELKALLVDGERKRLVKKLSESNQHNRFLKRELLKKDDDLLSFKTDLALLEAELQDLVTVAEEIAASSDTAPNTKKINGKPAQSYLASKLESVRAKLQQQVEGVELIKLQEVTLRWVGMAECVQVMGSFDGWSQGEDMSPEYDGSYTRFTTTLRLQPGRYEIKFLVDGVWRLSPELPTTGEGLTENNLLVL